MANLFPIDEFFFVASDNKNPNDLKRSVCTSLLFALSEADTFDLSEIWTLYRSSKPSGIFNGGAEVIANLNKVKRLSEMKLIEEDSGEKYFVESHFSLSKEDKPSERFLENKSRAFASKTVRLTPYGKEMVEILRTVEEDVKRGKTFEQAARRAIGGKIKIFYDESRHSILFDEVERLVRLNKKMTIKEIRLACEEFGFNAESADIFMAAETLCYTGCLKREKEFRCALTNMGDEEAHNESYSKTANKINRLLEKYFDKEKNLLIVPVELGEFVFDTEKMKRSEESDVNDLYYLIRRGYFTMSRTPYECDVPFAPIYYKDSFAGKSLRELAKYSYMERSLLAYKSEHGSDYFGYAKALLKFINAGLYSRDIDFEKLYKRCLDDGLE